MRVEVTRLLLACLAALLFPACGMGAERSFEVQGVPVVLDDVSTEVGVQFRSMRLNRAQGVWNAEMVLTNRSDRIVEGPLLVSVEELRGIGGWLGVDGQSGSPARDYLDFSAALEQGRLLPGQVTPGRTISLTPVTGQVPAPVLAVFGRLDPDRVALAWVQTLDESGLPLASVIVEESGPAGTTTRVSDSETGLLTLGDGGGSFLWKFSAEGYLPVWRRDVLDGSGVALLPNPQLTQRSTEVVQVTPLGGQVLVGSGGDLEIPFSAGQVNQTTGFTLTGLDAQSLPALLPSGWSPLQAFWLESDQALSHPLNLRATLWGNVLSGASAVLVRWDESALDWVAMEGFTGVGTNQVELALSQLGAFAVVIADDGRVGPEAGNPLMGVVPGDSALQRSDTSWQRMDLDASSLEAEGQVEPPLRLASLVPSEVTAEASVVIRHPGADLPSGLLLRGEISETYSLRDGTIRSLPTHERFFVGYRRPGGNPRELYASFPLRPQYLFPGEELVEVTVDVAVFVGGDFTGKVIGPKGGQTVFDNLKLLVSAGALPRAEGVRLRKLAGDAYPGWVPEGYDIAAAFELGVGELDSGARILFEAEGMPPDTLFVLGRALMGGNWRGFEPVERLATDSAGRLRSIEPAEGPRLGGIRQAGQYALVTVPQPQGVVAGVARDAAGEPSAGLPVRLNALPWLTISGDGGAFRLVAPEGESELAAFDPASGDFGSTLVTVVTPSAGVQADLAVVASGPRVVSVIPEDGARRVPASTSVQVVFSEPVSRTSFGANGIRLLAEDGAILPGGLSLNLSGTKATFLPAQQLSRGKTYTVEIDPGLADGTGLTLVGSNTFTFEVLPPSTRREGAQLVIYEPGATNIPPAITDAIPAFIPGEDPFAIVVHGQPGVADPEVPVVLTNESTGETQTVLSRVDGSFSSFIAGTEEDFISATFVNLNGTRVYVPVSRQEFDNGFVGLYQQGGILEAQSDGGPVQVILEPGDLQSRTKLAVQPVPLGGVMDFLNGIQPEGGAVVGGAVVSMDDPSQQVSRAELSFAVDLSALNLGPGVGPQDVTWGLAIPHDYGEGTVFEVIDELQYVDGELRTLGLPGAVEAPASALALQVHDVSALGRMEGDIVTEQIRSPMTVGLFFKLFNKLKGVGRPSNGAIDALGKGQKVLSAFGLPGIGETVTHQLLLPIMMSQGTSLSIGGTVKTARRLSDGRRDPDFAGEPVLGATIMLEQPPLDNRPGKLRPGTMYTSSYPPNGSYSFRFPVTLESAQLLVTGTHPRFPFQRPYGGVVAESLADRFNSGNFALLPLFFEEVSVDSLLTGEDPTPPLIRFAHSPDLPSPSSETAPSQAQLVVEALDDREIIGLRLDVQQVLRLGDGLLLEPGDVVVELLSEESTPNRLQQRYSISSPHRASVAFRAYATDASGNERQAAYSILFGGDPVEVQPENPDDQIGPSVVFTWPQSGAVGVQPGTPVVLRFSEPIEASMFLPGNLDWITFARHEVSSIEASPDYRQATIHYRGPSVGVVGFTLNSLLLDRNGQSFDQFPAEEGSQSYSVEFDLAEVITRELSPAPVSGGGVVFKGGYAYALDRLGPRDGEVAVFSVENPDAPVKVASISLPGYPSAMELLPDYSFKLGEGGECLSGDFLAVAGGNSGFEGPPKYLWVIDINDPLRPARLASAVISFSETARIHGMKWKAPLLGLTVLEGDVTSVQVFHLPKFVYGLLSSASVAAGFPSDGDPGLDANGDGDYCDEGDLQPLPSNQANQVFGFETSFGPLDPEERLMDFDIDVDRGLFGIVYRKVGAQAGRIGYRSIFYGGQVVPEEQGHVVLAENGFVKRLMFLSGTPVELSDAGEIGFRDLALITVSEDPSRLVLLDLSDPLNPVFIGYLTLPPGSGIAQSVQKRGDGFLVVVTQNRMLLLDPIRLMYPDSAEGHSAFIGDLGSIGSNMQRFVADTSGLNISSSGGDSRVLFSGPTFQIVTFPEVPEVAQIPLLSEAGKRQLLSVAREFPALSVDPLEFEPLTETVTVATPRPVSPETHHFVYLTMPGGAGAEVPLAAVSLSADGKRLQQGLSGGMPAFLLDSGSYDELVAGGNPDVQSGGEIPWKTELIARRLSDDVRSPLFNSYLAGPLVLTSRGLRLPQYELLEQQLERTYLRAGRYLWVGLAPGAAGQSSFLAGYASRVAGDEVLPGSSRIYPVQARKNPLILIPGVMGSLLEDGDKNAWMAVLDSSKASLSMNPDGSSEKDISPSDALRFIGQGTFAGSVLEYANSLSPDARELLTVYGKLIDYLTNELDYVEYDFRSGNDPKDMESKRGLGPGPDPQLGQDPRPNLFVFPYDWRLDNAESASRLEAYMEVVRHYHPDMDQVDIVAHSMGGLVARRFQMQNPDMVGRFISIGSPWLGAPKALGALKTGDFDDLAVNVLIDKPSLKRIGRNMKAVHQLLPSWGYFSLGADVLREVGWDANENAAFYENYTYTDYLTLLDEHLFAEEDAVAGGVHLKPIQDSNEPFHLSPVNGHNQDNWRSDTTGAEFYHVVGLQSIPATVGKVMLSNRLRPIEDLQSDVVLSTSGAGFTDFENGTGRQERALGTNELVFPQGEGAYRMERRLEFIKVAGDGTVPLLSAARGYGSTADFNAPGAIVLPVVSTTLEDDWKAGHNGMLKNDAVLRLVGDILGGLVPSAVNLQISAGGESLLEGVESRFSASITAAPVEAEGSPVYTWDFGDGAFQSGGSNAVHTFLDNGVYTVTCAVTYTNGYSGLTSRTVTVANQPPMNTRIRNGGVEVPVGYSLILEADFRDPGVFDSHTFEWKVDEGEPISGPFALSVSFDEEGSHSVSVRVIDKDGGEATATTTLTVSADAPVPAPPLADAAEESDPPLANGPPHLYVRVAGHDTDLVSKRIYNDGVDIYAPIQSLPVPELQSRIFRYLGGLFMNDGSEDSEFINVYRLNNSLSNPVTRTEIEVEGRGTPVALEVLYLEGNVPRIFYNAEVPSKEGDRLRFTFNWDEPQAASFSSNSIPITTAHWVLGRQAADRVGPLVQSFVDDATEEFELRTLDNFSAPEQTEVFFALDTDEDATFSDETFYPLTTKQFPRPVAPTRPVIYLARDAVGNLSELRSTEAEISPPEADYDCDQLNKVRAAVRNVIRRGLGQPLVRKMMINRNDAWFFEQGTGACLWKDDCESCRGVYIFGKSDNDYEMFFPVHYNDAPDLGTFLATDPHSAFNMEGDWYFRPPMALDENLQPVADAGGAAFFRYTLPNGRVNQDQEAFFDISVEEIPNPLTPAQVVSRELTSLVQGSAELKKFLPDVSFFPFRAEHFEYGVMSLERPPPFGDDPIGDAGMGRALLLLKWVLEGAYVTFDSGGLNADAPSLEMVFQNLKNQGIPLAEGFEWGVYQDFAALSGHTHLFVQDKPVLGPDGVELLTNLADGFDKHNEKSIKKAGKAAIRAALARLAGDPAYADLVLSVSPMDYKTAGLKSFEDFIASIAKTSAASAAYGTFREDIDDFLKAKLANKEFLADLRAQHGEEEFIRRCQQFLRTVVQPATLSTYNDYLADLSNSGMINELRARNDNMSAVEFGFRPSGSPRFFPGRHTMQGLDPNRNHTVDYDFTLQLQNLSDEAFSGINIAMDPGGERPLQRGSFSVDRKSTSTIKGNASKGQYFYLQRDVADPGTVAGYLAANSPGDREDESLEKNNRIEFEHRILGFNDDLLTSRRYPIIRVRVVQDGADDYKLQFMLVEGYRTVTDALIFIRGMQGEWVVLDNGEVSFSQLLGHIGDGSDLEVYGQTPDLEVSPTVTIQPFLTGLFRSGGVPTDAERNMLQCIDAQFRANQEDLLEFSKLMAFYLRPIWSEVLSLSSVAEFEAVSAEFDAVFADEASACRDIGKLLILDDAEWFNPGRQLGGVGKIYLHEGLRMLDPVPMFSGAAPAIDVIQVELLHEIDFRANYLVREGQPLDVAVMTESGEVETRSENLQIDMVLRDEFPEISPTYGFYRDSRQSPPTHPEPACVQVEIKVTSEGAFADNALVLSLTEKSEEIPGSTFFIRGSSGSFLPQDRSVTFAELAGIISVGGSVELYGEDPSGRRSPTLEIQPFLEPMFRSGRAPTVPELKMLEVLRRQYPLDGRGDSSIEEELAAFGSIMAYYLRPIWEDILSISTVGDFEMRSEEFNVSFSSEATACNEIGKPLVLYNTDYFNPGRQLEGVGHIYLHEDLTNAGSIALYGGVAQPIAVIHTETLHEIDYRAIYQVRGDDPQVVTLSSTGGGSSRISENHYLDALMMRRYLQVYATTQLYRDESTSPVTPKPQCP